MIFFFQAEDGIRDTSVTGVQTCALPISDAIQIRRAGRVTRIREYLLFSPPVPLPERRLQLAGSPTIVTRAEWQADESRSEERRVGEEWRVREAACILTGQL